MISKSELCNLEPKHERRFAQELSETVLIVKLFLEKPFKLATMYKTNKEFKMKPAYFIFTFKHFN